MVTSKRPWVQRGRLFSFVCKYFPLTLDLPSANVAHYVHFEAEGILNHDPKSSAAPEGGDRLKCWWPQVHMACSDSTAQPQWRWVVTGAVFRTRLQASLTSQLNNYSCSMFAHTHTLFQLYDCSLENLTYVANASLGNEINEKHRVYGMTAGRGIHLYIYIYIKCFSCICSSA